MDALLAASGPVPASTPEGLDARLAHELIADARNDWGSAWTDEYADALSASLERMRSLTEPRGIPLVVVSFPVSPQVEVDFAPVALWLPQRRTAEITRRLGIL